MSDEKEDGLSVGWGDEVDAEGWDDDVGGGGGGGGEAGDDGWGSLANSRDEWDDDGDVLLKGGAASAAAPPPVLARQSSAAVHSGEDVARKMESLAEVTAELLFVSPAEAACLLRHYGWKNAKLQQEWFEDQDKVRRACGVSDATRAAEAAKSRGLVVGPADSRACSTAFCEESASGYALACGHFFCDGCWRSYLESELVHGRTCVFATCPGMRCEDPTCTHKFGCACNEMVPRGVFERYVESGELLGKLDRWVLDSFVEGQARLAWCPRDCGNAVEYAGGGLRSVTCRCGSTFCFSCGMLGAHTPAPCDLVRKWSAKETSDDATEMWLAARTKTCPKCGVHIEKNKACNHMKCSNCQHDFCWLCKEPWKNHGSGTGGYYVCNKYNESAAKGNLSEEEKTMAESQRVLQKYTYYYKRFKNNGDAIRFTRRFKERVERDMGSADLARFAFVFDACRRIEEARSCLQWTYCMAYFLRAGREKNLFEYQQDMLTGHTEALQDILDNASDAHESLLDKRKQVIDLTGSIAKFTRESVQQVMDGAYEQVLNNSADESFSTWACVMCTGENKPSVNRCKSCGACRTHGEQDCKAAACQQG